MTQERFVLLGAAVCCVSALAVAKANISGTQTLRSPFDVVQANAAVETLAQMIEQQFIYPDVAKRYASVLRSRVLSGAYVKSTSKEAFAAAVTADLQAEYKEGHLAVFVEGPGAARAPEANPDHEWGVGKFGWLAPKVAYFSYNGF